MQPEENKWLVLREPLPPPAINPDLELLGAIPRSAECLRHFVLSVEFWLSPNGRLRQWMKLNLCLAAFLLIPAVFLMPILSLMLSEVDGWLSVLLSITWKLIVLSTIAFVVVCVLKSFPSSSNGSSRRRT